MNDAPKGAARDRVTDLYERYPYPPVDRDIDAYRRGDAWLLESPNPSFHHYWPYRDRTDDLDLLIAGCGTQQAAQIAAGLPHARIIGTDISASSLESTRQLADAAGLSNLELMICPIEDTASLQQEFDLVISTGVLHHLEDPEAGLRSLKEVLRPEGSMHLMVYGRHGRTGVYMLQELFRTLGLDPAGVSKRDINELRKLVEELPDAHPFSAVRSVHPDWQDDAGLVDLLLHVQDRAYSLPEVYTFLEQAGLKMQRLEFAARTDPAFTPLSDGQIAKHLRRIPSIDQRGAVELFRASVKKHVFVACHRDRPDSTFEIDLAPEYWDHLVPVVSFGLQVERSTKKRQNYIIRWPYHGASDICVEASDTAMKFLDCVDGALTVSRIFDQLGLDRGKKSLVRHIYTFIEMAARADFLTFASTRRDV